MVTLDDWDENQIKIKILLKGNSGTGKSRTCVKLAGIMARSGYNVLYMDGEGGAERELKNLKADLSAEQNRRIEYERFGNYKEMSDKLVKEVGQKGDKLKLIIIDPLKLVEIARLSARDIYLEQGFAPSGYGVKDIKNKESFDLSGTSYQLSTTMVAKFLDLIVNVRQDIICTLTIKETKEKEYRYKNEYDATFDFVYETLAESHMGNLVFKAYPKKRRGARTTDSTLVNELLKEIVDIFTEKYSVPIVKKTDSEKIDVDIGENKNISSS